MIQFFLRSCLPDSVNNLIVDRNPCQLPQFFCKQLCLIKPPPPPFGRMKGNRQDYVYPAASEPASILFCHFSGKYLCIVSFVVKFELINPMGDRFSVNPDASPLIERILLPAAVRTVLLLHSLHRFAASHTARFPNILDLFSAGITNPLIRDVPTKRADRRI